MKKIISTENAPKAIGPYSQAVEAGGFLFTAGQIPVNPKTGIIPEGIKKQTEQALLNLKAVIEAGGFSFSNVVKVMVFLKDMNTFSDMNEVYADFFKENFPSRSAVEVARLPKDVLIEIEAVVTR